MATSITSIRLLCFALTFKAVIGFKSSGKHFVASCPWLRDKASCTAYLSTSEKIAEVTISEINQNITSKTQKIFVGQKKLESYLLDSENEKYREPIAKYHVRVFMSDKSFRIIVNTLMDQGLYTKTDALVLSPKTNCYNSYYTVTAKASPFVTIFSFEYSETDVKVKFPKYTPPQEDFNLNCFASEHCAPEKTVTVRMLKYEAWYFTLDDENSNLMNVLITSNNPVYVVSGNCYGWSRRDDASWDIATTSLKSYKTWGKTYIVPSMVSTPLSFAINTIEIPLTYEVHEDQSQYSFSVVESNQTEIFDYVATTNTLAITADIPFGLYQIFSSRSVGTNTLGDVSILNLIPEEQWTRGTLLMGSDFPDNFQINYYLITQALPKDITFPSSVNKENDLTWHTSKIKIKGKIYSIAEFKVDIPKGRIFVNNPMGTMMIYVTLRPSSFMSIFFGTFPYDFNQGDIYQKSCTVSKTFCTHDGIDNDCDGYIDEETVNGVDDDSDGLVDEDNREPYSDGHWSSWTHACDQLCNGMELSVRVRSCLDRSPDGIDCDGDSIQCDEMECPRDCGNAKRKSTDCFCKAGCSSCGRNIFECASCKAGYSYASNCLKKHPEGWTGAGCPIDETKTDNPKGPVHKDKKEKKKTNDTFQNTEDEKETTQSGDIDQFGLIVGIIGYLIIAIVFIISIVLYKRFRNIVNATDEYGYDRNDSTEIENDTDDVQIKSTEITTNLSNKSSVKSHASFHRSASTYV